ncbi:tetraspanin-33 [Patella vulgata]|uniref:tetraspanin-33 n=1 Tax=Patella vulgata TaxID=6465 RepID=UPI00217FBD61|nr:tetraspanin-33 [Patella vulgata]
MTQMDSPRRRLTRRERSEVNICVKYLLFFENFIAWLVGLICLSLGAYILVLKKKVIRDAIDFILDPACVITVAGALMFLLAFFGCMGALRENTTFLKIFYYITTLCLLGEIVLAILAFIFYYAPNVRDQMNLFPEKTFKDAIVKYRDDPDMQNLIDSFQQSLGCCGLSNNDEGYKDWLTNLYFNCSSENKSPERCSVPPSCCKLEPGEKINLLCGGNVLKLTDNKIQENDISNIYTKGCLKAVGDWINTHSLVIGGAALGVLLPQIFIICMSRNLIDQVKAQKSKWR